MELEIFNNIRLEYSVGANVIIFSVIDTSADKTVLTNSNVSSIRIEYSYNGNDYFVEEDLHFHMNSMLIFLTELPENTDIIITPFIIKNKKNGRLKYKIRLAETFTETTLPYGNIEYQVLSSGNPIDTTIREKISEVVGYINAMGSYVNVNFDEEAQYAKVIPVQYDPNVQTASALYYRYKNNDPAYGLILTSGGVYVDNDTFYHELRHRYGINGRISTLTRDRLENRSDLYSYIEDKFEVIHKAEKFESGREDAKIWIFDGHSNISEGKYTNEGKYNYLAANLLKALIWYTSHSPEEEDTSKIRIILQLNLEIIYGDVQEEIEDINKSEDSFDDTIITEKLINVGKYKYLCRYYHNPVDNVVNNFIILRNFEITNDIIYDKDIFFIDRNIYEEIKHTKDNSEICFPIYKNNKLFFTDSQELFNTYKFDNLEDMSYNIFQDDSEGNPINADIKCDKIRIYNPVISKDLDFIIYIDNYINNIHFHYFCTLNSNYIKRCEEEIKIGNDKYIEYIEFKIPNIEKIFDSKYYINDEYNNIIESTAKNINEYFDNDRDKTEDIKTNKINLNHFIKPYLIKDNNKIFIDNDDFNYNMNYMNKNILKITLYPYSSVINHFYINSDINPVTAFINHDNYFRLHSELGFDNNIISILNTFEFPGKIENKDNHYEVDILGDYEEEEYSDLYGNQITEYYNSYYLNDNIQYLIDKEDNNEELDVENIRTTGYLIQIADDIYFKNIIFESVINTDNNENNFIYDFSFSLNNIIQSWSQLNEILIIRTKFIDKRLNIVITGNNIVLNKEWFKYLINDTDINHVLFNNQNNLIKKDFMDINNGYNFIDKINCIVNESPKEQLNVQVQSQNTQIIYKPIFYKVQDLQNIRIKENVIQNIGINLSEYMTKIKLFILNINGLNIKESSRNDIYVIFKINASNIEEYSGTYNILDENFEYISSGNYTLY